MNTKTTLSISEARKKIFKIAEDHAPSIVFIDEIDAVGSKRYDSSSGGEKEV